ncbi:MAG TPA: diaminopimelate decarboxylase [Egibacteraceae bacterium]|nr:diaminopimelate decarboxylase [Egibacteraceae bacterium]
MTTAGQIFPRSAAFSGERLMRIGGIDVGDLVAEYGTPLYVMDRAELVGRMRSYRAAFGPDVGIAYAAKALCVTGVLQLAAAEGMHIDVASGGELRAAQRAGVDMARVIFHGNNKSVEELEQAVELGVGRVVADSFAELSRLSAIAAERGRDVAILLRVTPGVEAKTHAFVRTGHDDSKFGFTMSAGLATQAAEQAVALPGLTLVGAHCHIGSQIFEPEAFDAAASAMFGHLAELRAMGAPVEELNLGGGLGITYGADDIAPSIQEYAAKLLSSVEREADRHGVPLPRLFVEPGRSIAGPAGVTLYTVGTIKDIPGVRTYVSVDGGLSDHLRTALYGSRYTFAVAGDGEHDHAPGAGQRQVTIVGKNCESGDVLGRDVALAAKLAEGDLLAVAATGAYGHAMASNYNNLPRPAMVLVADGSAQLLVRRETIDDVVARDVPLDLG